MVKYRHWSILYFLDKEESEEESENEEEEEEDEEKDAKEDSDEEVEMNEEDEKESKSEVQQKHQRERLLKVDNHQGWLYFFEVTIFLTIHLCNYRKSKWK